MNINQKDIVNLKRKMKKYKNKIKEEWVNNLGRMVGILALMRRKTYQNKLRANATFSVFEHSIILTTYHAT